MAGARHAFYTTLALLAPVLLWHFHKTRSRRKAKRLPALKSVPLLGSLPYLPIGESEHDIYIILGKQLESDIFYLELFGHELVVLNSSQAASDLFEKRSSLYSDRFCPPILGDKTMFDWSTNPVFLGYNDTWRHHRRMMNKWLSKREGTQFYNMQEKRARNLLQRFLEISTKKSPFPNVKDEINFAMAASIFQAAYGYTLQGKNDTFYQAAHRADKNAVRAVVMTRGIGRSMSKT
ncbi:unnamed protein product, partial [Rhizoctonia solani]